MYLGIVDPAHAERARDAAAELDLEKRQLIPIGSFLSSLLVGEPTTVGRPSRTVTVTSTRTPTSTLRNNIGNPTSRFLTATERSTGTLPLGPFTTRTITTQNAINTGIPDSSQTGPAPRKGLPPVVIGIIVAAAVIFGLVFIALLARKFFQRRRRNKRTTWGGSMISPYEPPMATKQLPGAPIASQYASTTNNNRSVGGGAAPVVSQYSNYSAYPAYPPATVSYGNQNNNNTNNSNNNPATGYSPAAASSAGYGGPYSFANAKASGSNTRAPAPVSQLSVVKRTFVPSLPDELSIANGETVRVLSVYDDGWALCEKINGGEKGVVPQECLEAIKKPGPSNGLGQQLAQSDKGVRRNSSLRRDAENIY